MNNPLVAGSRSLAIIDLVANRSSGVSFTVIAAELALSPASLTRLLKMLLSEDWIRHDTHTATYVAGHRLMHLGESMRAQSPVASIVAPIVEKLADKTGHSACFAMSQDYYFLLHAKAEKRRSFRFMELLVPNLDWIDNGMGQFFLAFRKIEDVQDIYKGYFRRDVPDEHLQTFEQIRKNRFFVSDEGHVTRVMAAVALRDHAEVDALISLAASRVESADLPELTRQVVDAAAAVEGNLNASRVPAINVLRRSPGRRWLSAQKG